MKKLGIVAHRPLVGDSRGKPRGGEISMSIIRDAMEAAGIETRVAVHLMDSYAPLNDVGCILTWGRAASTASDLAKHLRIPYIVSVRWWRNVVPNVNEIGDLSRASKSTDYFRTRLFRDAFRTITNNEYSANVLRRMFDIEPLVSYVPITTPIGGNGNPKGATLLVTDNKGLGEREVLRGLAEAMPDREFIVVNAHYKYREPNIEAIRYVDDMETIWPRVGILIYPNYLNDVCGTSRVAAEAMSRGIPAIANDRAGICEKGMLGISRDAFIPDWVAAIETVFQEYEVFSADAVGRMQNYNSDEQLAVYTNAVLEAFQ